MGATVDLVDNNVGIIDEINGQYWLTFNKMVSKTGKEFECIHSGDLNDIMLPTKLPAYTILRRKIDEALANKGLTKDSTPVKQEAEYIKEIK
jgi:putative protease